MSLFLGDTLLEREGTYGYLETRMHQQFPDRHFTVRNLAFSADTPLGWSRASFDPAVKGFERLKEQLDLVKPTVVFLGYGMAASLQEITDRSGDPTLNPDPVRYGAEPMTATRFKGELGQLMDAIDAANKAQAGTGVRYVLLSPIRHEDLRKQKPGLPDPTAHNKLLEQYSAAIAALAKERAGTFVSLGELASALAEHLPGPQPAMTDNGIHLNDLGYNVLGNVVSNELGWATDSVPSAALRPAVIRKNELFFHRWRPANSTYLFGFRKHEQGQNAKEIPEFDPLIEAADAEIDRLKKAGAQAQASGQPAPVAPISRDQRPRAHPAAAQAGIHAR
ncbi:MAG: GDSL-type esterase/lipase family protein [Chthoniobacter sp.]